MKHLEALVSKYFNLLKTLCVASKYGFGQHASFSRGLKNYLNGLTEVMERDIPLYGFQCEPQKSLCPFSHNRTFFVCFTANWISVHDHDMNSIFCVSALLSQCVWEANISTFLNTWHEYQLCDSLSPPILAREHLLAPIHAYQGNLKSNSMIMKLAQC